MPRTGDLVTQDGQMEWRGLLLGERSPYMGVELKGWDDLPEVESGNALRPTEHGAWPGTLWAGTRELEWKFRIVPPQPANFPDALSRLRAVTGIVQEETPLVVQLAGARRLLWARVIKREILADRSYTRGHPEGTVVWESTDPLRYEVTEQVARAYLPPPAEEITWPLAWPLEWREPCPETGSTYTRVQVLTVDNQGDAPAHPVIEFHGPVVRPSLTDVTTGRVLEYAAGVDAGDVLTVDCKAGTVMDSTGASRLHTVTARSVPERTFTLNPGVSRLIFDAEPERYDPRTCASVIWRSAYW